jgi:hypothetical protein
MGCTKKILKKKINLASSKAPCVSMRSTATSFPPGVFTMKISDQINILLEKRRSENTCSPTLIWRETPYFQHFTP